jgi:hypothetical protein
MKVSVVSTKSSASGIIVQKVLKYDQVDYWCSPAPAPDGCVYWRLKKGGWRVSVPEENGNIKPHKLAPYVSDRMAQRSTRSSNNMYEVHGDTMEWDHVWGHSWNINPVTIHDSYGRWWPADSSYETNTSKLLNVRMATNRVINDLRNDVETIASHLPNKLLTCLDEHWRFARGDDVYNFWINARNKRRYREEAQEAIRRGAEEYQPQMKEE